MMTTNDKAGLTRVAGEAVGEGVPEDPDAPAVGRWYWALGQEEGEPRRLVFVRHVGSNYAEVGTVGGSFWRIHLDHFDLVPEPNAEAIVAREVERHRREVGRLMGEVQRVTEALAITTGPRALQAGAEANALALRGTGQPVEEYKTALVKAKKETLPELFKQIECQNKSMALWMKAGLLPLEAQVEPLKGALKAIEGRIFNVELYAGLVEHVKEIAGGAPAPLGTKVHLMQRRAYMDEECLANYEAGGMDFNGIAKFDRWLARPANRDRVLPFPRAVIAFQVRRREKEREIPSFRDWVNIVLGGERDTDKWTFLYIRNGERMYRLDTSIEFGAKLFPDLDGAQLVGKLRAKVWGGSGHVDEIITEGNYLAQKAEYEAAERKHEAEVAAWEKLSKKERKERIGPSSYFYHSFRHDQYEPFDPSSVYYDDIRDHVKEQMDAHNRIVLLLQGLFDRSPVFHPHKPVRLWEPAGFHENVELVYDEDRALTPGAAPDFEEYRTRLNETLAAGSVVVGQEEFWERAEAVKENARERRSWRGRREFEVKRYRPHGNPGPGTLARVVKVSGRGVLFKWTRERVGRINWWQRSVKGASHDDRFPCSITVPLANVLNVSAYKKGDFKRFFADPRTRADYLQWAPLLLPAEDYACGKWTKSDLTDITGDD